MAGLWLMWPEKLIKPSPNALYLLKECGFSIGDSVWIRPNSSDWSGDWRNEELMVIGVKWNVRKRDWEFECVPLKAIDEFEVLYELDLDHLVRFNLWE